jgi:PhnO protein
MELAVTIRNIEESDFEYIYSSLCDLENQTLDAKALKEIFSANISNEKYLYLIAESEATKVGFITFHTQNLMHHVGLVGEIQEFYISPGYRGKGVGRQLIAKIIAYSEEHQLKSIEVQTNIKRVENVAIYENLGFTLSHNKFTIYR